MSLRQIDSIRAVIDIVAYDLEVTSYILTGDAMFSIRHNMMYSGVQQGETSDEPKFPNGDKCNSSLCPSPVLGA